MAYLVGATHVILDNTDKWLVRSFGNGGAYDITNKQTGKSIFIQWGDDAAAFRKAYDEYAEISSIDITSYWYDKPWDDVLDQLASDFGME